MDSGAHLPLRESTLRTGSGGGRRGGSLLRELCGDGVHRVCDTVSRPDLESIELFILAVRAATHDHPNTAKDCLLLVDCGDRVGQGGGSDQ